jgi:hypothetical protein
VGTIVPVDSIARRVDLAGAGFAPGIIVKVDLERITASADSVKRRSTRYPRHNPFTVNDEDGNNLIGVRRAPEHATTLDRLLARISLSIARPQNHRKGKRKCQQNCFFHFSLLDSNLKLLRYIMLLGVVMLLFYNIILLCF